MTLFRAGHFALELGRAHRDDYQEESALHAFVFAARVARMLGDPWLGGQLSSAGLQDAASRVPGALWLLGLCNFEIGRVAHCIDPWRRSLLRAALANLGPGRDQVDYIAEEIRLNDEMGSALVRMRAERRAESIASMLAALPLLRAAIDLPLDREPSYGELCMCWEHDSYRLEHYVECLRYFQYASSARYPGQQDSIADHTVRTFDSIPNRRREGS